MELIKAKEMKNEFIDLFNTYIEELANYNPWLLTQRDKNGNYLYKYVNEYINNEEYKSFCIVEDNKAVGFVVFNYNNEEGIFNIEEFFVISEKRGRGICEDICKRFWNENKGLCILHVIKFNLYAVEYWEKLIKRQGYYYEKIDKSEKMFCYEIKIL